MWASHAVLVVKNPPANARDTRGKGSIPGLGRSPGGGHGNPLKNTGVENPINRETGWAPVSRVPKSGKRLTVHV